MATKFVKYYPCLVEDHGMSQEAALLYCLLRDLAHLSKGNPQYHDEHGVPFVVMSVKTAGKKLGCKDHRARKAFKECEKCQLIKRVVPVRGFAARTYINPCKWIDDTPSKKETTGPPTYLQVIGEVYRTLEIEYLCQAYPAVAGLYREVASNVAELYATHCDTVYIAGEWRTREDVHAHLQELTPQHIEGIVENFCKCTDEIKNSKRFLQACIYNAVGSHHAYYINQVNCDN